VATSQLTRYLGRRPPSRVIVETAAESFHVADQILKLGHEVRVVPATLVRSLGVGARRIKTDKHDAQILSEVSCRIDLPSVHIPSEASRELKAIINLRDGLVSSHTKLINGVRGWLRGQGRRIRTGSSRSFAERIRTHFESTQAVIPDYVDRQLVAIDQLREQITAADRDVRRRAKAHEICRRLMTVPGIGPVTALRFVAALDDPARFRNAHAVGNYLGLTPGEHSSSDRKSRTGITKAGDPLLRSLLIQAAWSARRCRTSGVDPMVTWSKNIERRRGKFVAVVALARKIAGVLYALWRDGTTYDPKHQMRN
jgi:transposase